MFPQHHFWLVNPSKLNLYANTTVSVGDALEIKNKQFEITKCAMDSAITAEVTGNPEIPLISDSTNFYNIEVKEVS